MPKIPEFMEAIDKMVKIHESKNTDYSTPENPLSNFDVSAYFASLFKNPRDQAFAVLLGAKLGRLASLLNSDKEPNNESIEDTFIDSANYHLLWRTDYLRRHSIITSKIKDDDEIPF